MSLLNLPTATNATGEVKEVFDEIHGMFGIVPSGLQIWGVSPEALKAQWEAVKPVLSKEKQEQKLHAIIRYLISYQNASKYCIDSNSAMLLDVFSFSNNGLDQLRQDPSTATLNKKYKALLLLAMKSSKDPSSVSQEDIDNLASLGATEKEMFDIVHAAAQMTLANTIFNTFKIESN